MKRIKTFVAWILVVALCMGNVDIVKAQTGDGEDTDTPALTSEVTLPVSGVDDGIEWSISEEGELVVSGEGMGYWYEFIEEGSYLLIAPPWKKYSSMITSAKINAKVERVGSWFANCENLITVDMSEFDTSNVTDMSAMFWGCSNLSNLDVSNFDTSNVTNMGSMFSGCSNLSNLDVSNFDTSNVTNMGSMFSDCSSLSSLDVSNFDTGNVTDMSSMFWDCSSLSSLDVSNFDTCNVTDMSWMFWGCSNLSSLDVSNFDTGNVTDMSSMFEACSSLSSLDVSNFDTGNVTDMSSMFAECSSLSGLELSNFDTSNVMSMSSMFEACSSLSSLNVSNFDTSNVMSMSFMFYGSSNLDSLNVSNFDISNVTDINSMFGACSSLSSLDVSNFNTSNVTDMRWMFEQCSSLSSLDVSNFDTSNVTNIDAMFDECRNLERIKCFPKLVQNVWLPQISEEPYCYTWYDENGNSYENYFPLNLEEGIWLYRGEGLGSGDVSPADPPEETPEEPPVSTIPAIDNSFGTTVAVYDYYSRMPIENVRVGTYVGVFLTYYTDKNGCINFQANELPDKRVVLSFSKKGYHGTSIELDRTKSLTKVYLKKDENINITVPAMEVNTKAEDSVEILGMDISWLDMDFEFKFKKKVANSGRNTSFPVKVAYDHKKHTAKVTFGINESDETGDINKSYNMLKDICEKVDRKVGTTEEVSDFFRKYGAKPKEKDKNGVEVETKIMGYIEYDLNTKRILESGAVVGMEGSGTQTHRPACALGIVYFTTKITLSAEGTLLLEFEDDDVSFQAEIELEQALKVAGGVGTSGTHLEIGSEGKFKETLRLPFKSPKESLELKLVSRVYGEASLFGSKVTKYWEKEFSIWPYKKNESEGNGGGSRSVDLQFYPESLEPLERNYTFYSTSPQEQNFDLSDLYPEADPQMVTLSDGSLLAVWITDDGSKSAANRTTLVWSVLGENGWSPAKAVYETGRSDYTPVLTTDGNKAVVAWYNAGQILESDQEVISAMEDVDVCVSVFEDGKFSTPTYASVQGNDMIELDVCVAMDEEEIAVAWVENSANNPFMSEGNNSVWIAICHNGVWSRTCVQSDLVLVQDLALTYVGTQPSVAYTLDMDNARSTQEDIELFMWQNGQTMRLTSDCRTDMNLQFLQEKLYWLSDGALMEIDPKTFSPVNTKESCSLNITEINNFYIMENGNGRSVLINKADGFYSELYLSTETADGFTTPVPVTSYKNKISDYAAAYKGDRLHALIVEREVLGSEESVYGVSNLHMTEELHTDNLQLQDAWWVEEEKTDTEWPVEMKLYNGGSKTINALQVSLKLDEQVLCTKTVSYQLLAGTEGFCKVFLPVQDEWKGKNVSLYVWPVDASGEIVDNREDDNSCKLPLGLADIAVQDFAIEQIDDAYVLSGKVRNEGCMSAKQVQFSVLEGGMDGKELYSLDCGELAAGAEQEISFTIPENCLVFEECNDSAYFYVLGSSDDTEAVYDNNSENIVAFPIRAEGINLAQKELSVTVGSTEKLTATVFPENALEQKVHYTSNNHAVAVVLDDGSVIGCEEGTAVITVVSADGGYSEQCSVTVTAPETETTAYELSERWIALQSGESKQLALWEEEEQAVTGVVWESSDSNVATVSEAGLVKAVGAGDAYIIAYLPEQQYSNVCVVHVLSEENFMLNFEQLQMELIEGEQQTQLPVLFPEEAEVSGLQWGSSDSSVAEVSSDGTVTAKSEGMAEITVSYKTIEASYTVFVTALPRYTVYFDSGLGEEPIEVSGVLAGERVSLPQNPQREGYTFVGWYTEPNGKGEHFTENTTIQDTIWVYAFWEMNQVAEGFWVSEVVPQTYTGKAIRPSVLVYDGMKLLQEKVDYTVSYKNNVKVADKGAGKKAPMVVIKGKGDYTGTENIVFSIVAKDLSDEDVQVADLWASRTGKVQKPIPSVMWNSKQLKNNKDFEISYPDMKDLGGNGSYQESGEYRVLITGKGDYTGEKVVTFTITDAALISGAKVKGIPSQDYTGNEIKPKPTVTLKGKTLTEGVDYSLDYEQNIAPGTATITIKGLGDYAGLKQVKFKINGQSIKGAQVSNISNLVYNGEKQVQDLKVMLNDDILRKGIDYEVQYRNNQNVGTATATIIGKGAYSGTIVKKFKIQPYDLEKDEAHLLEGLVSKLTVPYEKGGSKPEPELKFAGKLLSAKKDYTLSYVNNTKLTTAENEKTPIMTIKGKGNFVGTLEIPFHIVKRNLSEENQPVRITVADKVYSPKAGKYISVPVLIDCNGKKLKAGVDYEKEISYTLIGEGKSEMLDKTSVVAAGENVLVTVKGKGCYEGILEATYHIGEASFSKAKITIATQEYTGSDIVLTEKDLKVTIGNTTLKYGEDYEIVDSSYRNNQKKGTATVSIRGIGNYAGSKDVKFKIKAKRFDLFWYFVL